MMAMSAIVGGEPFLLPRISSPICRRRGPLLVCSRTKHVPVAASVGKCKDEVSLGDSLATASLAAALTFSLAFNGFGVAEARPEGVNKPELLPKSFTPVIDAAGFLSEGQEGRIVEAVTNLEEETGFKLRVLAQNYPNTPGLAIKDFWKVDDSTIVFVADPSLGEPTELSALGPSSRSLISTESLAVLLGLASQVQHSHKSHCRGGGLPSCNDFKNSTLCYRHHRLELLYWPEGSR